MEKTCRACHQTLSLVEFNKKRTTRDGLQPDCRACNAKMLRDWGAKNRERKRQMDRDYAAANRERACAKTRAWKAANPGRKKENDRRYVAENRERVREQGAAYRAANRSKIQAVKETYRIENRERIRELRRAWKRANKAKVLADVTLRKMRKRQATPPWLTREQRIQMRQAYELAEIYTGTFGEPYHVDHIVPINHPLVCGLHVPWNLQVLRGADNIAKSNTFDPDAHKTLAL